ncbi:MAG: DNA recombination protein RmuC [Elusimicrobiota bacterium]|jgi:DNA recombination protein RmuC
MLLSLVALTTLLVIVVVGLLLRMRRPSPDAGLSLMQQQIDSLRKQVSENLSQNATLLQKQLEAVSHNLRDSSGEINQRLDNAAKIYGDLRNQLGQLSQANIQIQSMVKDITSLQDILRPPKLRGGMGEVLLENLLREILPPEHLALQHRFQTGNVVDAIIRLKDGIVPVDAKFPLENFRRMLEAKTDEERRAARKEFVRNVKKHIDDIREKYVLPDEGTFPFALMYIPAENVYYETIIKGEEEDGEKALYAYATSRQVMPVSPNSFYVYLMTLAQGFRGMRVEERAKEIIQQLNRLRDELMRFTEDFRKVGMHISNAQTRFSEAERRLTRFEEKLISAGDRPMEGEPAAASIGEGSDRLNLPGS